MKRTPSQNVFNVFNILFLLAIVMTIILPIMHVFSVSLSERAAVLSRTVGVFPKGFRFDAYVEIINKGVFIRSLLNTVFLTVVTTVLSLIVNILAAYAFTRNFFGKKFLTYYFVLTMYFSGGLIPSYLLVSKYLQLNNSFLAYILPSLVSFFYIIVIRSQIEAIPTSLSEAAIVDGATERQVLMHIIIPVITATIAAVGMFTALGVWNMWFGVMLYSTSQDTWTLQYYLRAVVFERVLETDIRRFNAIRSDVGEQIMPENFQMAAIILTALPIVAVYPFIQKYFVKGLITGSVKG